MGNDTKKKKPAVKAEKVIDGTPAVKAQGVKEAVPVPAAKAERVIDGTPATKVQGVRDVNGIPATHPAMVREAVPATHPTMVREAVVATHPEMVQEAVGTPAVKVQGVADTPTVQDLYYEQYLQDSMRPDNLVETGKQAVPAAKVQGVREAAPATHPAMVKDVVPSVQTQTVSVPKSATVQAQTKRAQSSSKPKAAPATTSPQRPTKLEAVNNGLKDSLPNPKEIQWQYQNTNDAPEASPTARLEQARWDAILKKHQEENKPKTLSDLLEEQRKKVETEKTDAAKMQKYYALADAFNALGKMGGAAIGGAIGGDMVGGAPTVAEYQPSKGYIDAFEKAKNANERLRALDDKEFNLAVRDEERSYNQQVAKADRDFKAQQAQLDRDWQMTFYDYKSKIEQANAQSNLKLKNDLEKELLAIENQFKAKYQAIANAHEEKLKNLSLDIVKLQNQGSNELVAFDDGTTMSIPESYYKSMFNYYNGREINGMQVDKDNFAEFVRKNPKHVSSFLNLFNQKLASSQPVTPNSHMAGGTYSQPRATSAYTQDNSPKPAAKTPSNAPVVDEDGIEWI